MQEPFLDRLSRGGLLFDGAIGTGLMETGGLAPERLGLAGLEAPGLLSDLHRSFLEAGSEVLLTGTFAANRPALGAVGGARLHPRAVEEAARIACDIAREEGGVWVLGDLGPIGLWARGASSRQLIAAYREEARLLAESGVDGLIVETLPGLFEAALALESLRDVTDLPVCISLSFHRGREGELATLDGEPLPDTLGRLEAAGADALGLNCGEGSAVLLEVLPACLEAVRSPLVARPSPGSCVGGISRTGSPAAFAEHLGRAHELGAAGLGGCCGAGAEFISALRDRLVRC